MTLEEQKAISEIVKILKKRFNNLSAIEVTELAMIILSATQEAYNLNAQKEA